MKNINAILEGKGLSEEDVKAIVDEVNANYKPVADWQKQVDKVKDLTDTLETTKGELAKFDGVNTEELNKKIKELNDTITKNQAEFDAKIADRDFNDLIDRSISAAKGKNAKAIRALLDIDALKSSKNQQKDIETALAGLTEAEDSKMLFGEPEPTKIGEGNPIGTVTKDNNSGLSGVEKAFYERTGVKLE